VAHSPFLFLDICFIIDFLALTPSKFYTRPKTVTSLWRDDDVVASLGSGESALMQQSICLPPTNPLHLFSHLFQFSPCPNLVKTIRNNLPPFSTLFFVRVKNPQAMSPHSARPVANPLCRLVIKPVLLIFLSANESLAVNCLHFFNRINGLLQK
jgi:hypothetical protein